MTSSPLNLSRRQTGKTTLPLEESAQIFQLIWLQVKRSQSTEAQLITTETTQIIAAKNFLKYRNLKSLISKSNPSWPKTPKVGKACKFTLSEGSSLLNSQALMRRLELMKIYYRLDHTRRRGRKWESLTIMNTPLSISKNRANKVVSILSLLVSRKRSFRNRRSSCLSQWIKQ